MSWHDMTYEQCCLEGICGDCGGGSKKWTQEEINIAKDDIGMGDDDDFFDCCPKCMISYMPPEQFSKSDYAKEFFNNFIINNNQRVH